MSDFIRNISIVNFKSIRQISLENCARINLIIGKPNTGKSNILEALSLFSMPFLRVNKAKKITQLIRCEKLSELFHFGNTKKPILAVMDASTCVVKYHQDETLTFETNDGANLRRYQVDKTGRFRSGRNQFDSPKVKRYIFTEITKPLKRHFNFPVPPHGLKFAIPESSQSETMKRVDFFKTAIKSNTNSILLFEEPEANCFQPFTTLITQEMINNPENQYFLTSYSSFMIYDLLENAGHELAIFKTDLVNHETVIRKLSGEELNKLFQKGVDTFTESDI